MANQPHAVAIAACGGLLMRFATSIVVVFRLVSTAALVATIVPTGRAFAAPPAAALFLNPTSSTNSAALRIDRDGGMHLAAAAYHTGEKTDDPRKPAYYAYCAPALDCTQAESWTGVTLGADVRAAQVDVTPEGRPRLLLQTADTAPGTPGYTSYWYAECDAGCNDLANWSLIDLVNTTAIDISISEQPKHSFALDPQGRPRFVFGEGALVYAACDIECTAVATDPDSGATVPAKWSGTLVGSGLNGSQRALAFNSAGQPRIGALTYEPGASRFTVDYFECNVECNEPAQWSRLMLMKRGQAPESMSIRVDSQDRVGIALGQDTGMWYWQCASECTDFANWMWRWWRGLAGEVEDIDLAFDQQNAPHLALRSTGGGLGWGLWHFWCLADCTTDQPTWTAEMIEDADALARDFPLLPPADCSASGWMGDFRPSMALDAAGIPNLAFDNQFWVGPCESWDRIRTHFATVRILVRAQPRVAADPVVTAARALAASSLGGDSPEHSPPGPAPA
jgi:hypothetical protein